MLDNISASVYIGRNGGEMILTILALLTFSIGLIWYLENESSDGATVALAIGVIVMVAVIGTFLMNPISVNAHIVQYQSVQETINQARTNPDISPMELAALQQKAVDENKWLANVQFWAKHPLTNWFVPKVVFQLKPIR